MQIRLPVLGASGHQPVSKLPAATLLVDLHLVVRPDLPTTFTSVKLASRHGTQAKFAQEATSKWLRMGLCLFRSEVKVTRTSTGSPLPGGGANRQAATGWRMPCGSGHDLCRCVTPVRQSKILTFIDYCIFVRGSYVQKNVALDERAKAFGPCPRSTRPGLKAKESCTNTNP